MIIRQTRIAAVLVTGALLAGCATQGGNTAAGTGVGAALGAGLGALIGDSSKSAGIGAGIGAIGGAIVGYNWDRIVGRVNDAGGKELGISTTKMPDGSLKVNIPEGATFDTAKYDLKPALFPVLDALAQSMNESQQLRLKSVGHTDSTGKMAFNQQLSVNRAQSVVNYLGGKGVNASRMSIEGRGPNDPIADNATEAGRAQNRRVELYLYAVK
ncbi:membrane protein [Advenella kashmirensis W13003]|uniref:Membrane protein n=1 Tax=Advenella kashmirensis W13003 TaxID=1424334 RepID=V8QYZ5_9BURK|nr:OmpA family protein [Advenella kashmirensis]ETF04244.1 membrane protein [Advenella kashmirensis W13003]